MNAAGDTARGNSRGILVSSGPNLTIGGTVPAARNVISGNLDDGILVTSAGGDGAVIRGNYIGLDVGGTTDIGNASNGIEIDTTSSVVVGGDDADDGLVDGTVNARNVISGNDANGVFITGASDLNTIEGNYIGTDFTGDSVLVGNTLDGIVIEGGTNNVIGGSTAGAGNLISANQRFGILITDPSSSTTIEGNLIGTDPTGELDRGNVQSGIDIARSPNNTVHDNVISGNDENGIILSGAGAINNTVSANFIGTDDDGESPVANQLYGVLIMDDASSNTIGGDTVGAGNVVSGNSSRGIRIDGLVSDPTNNLIQGNFIGSDVTGLLGISNSVGIEILRAPDNTIGGTTALARNVIVGNASHGINVNGGNGTVIRGNYIGLGSDGETPVPNVSGALNLAGSITNALIADNVIGSGRDGVVIVGPGVDGNTFENNLINTNASETLVSGFINVDGINVNGGINNLFLNNTIARAQHYGIVLTGGASGNIFRGNAIGTNSAGTLDFGNVRGGCAASRRDQQRDRGH